MSCLPWFFFPTRLLDKNHFWMTFCLSSKFGGLVMVLPNSCMVSFMDNPIKIDDLWWWYIYNYRGKPILGNLYLLTESSHSSFKCSSNRLFYLGWISVFCRQMTSVDRTMCARLFFVGRNFIWAIEHTLWLFNIAMENDPFIDDFPIKTSIYGWDFPWLC